MKLPRLTGLLIPLLLAAPAAPQQASEKTASETVVVPGLPGSGANKEVRIGGQDIYNAEITGPEISFTARVVQWEEGRSITVILPNGDRRPVPVPSNIIFPPDLRPGGDVTFLVRQTSDGRYRVTGLTTGMTTAPPLTGAAPPPPPEPAPAPEMPAPATVSAPPVSTQPGAPPKRGKTVVGASYITVSGTVKALTKGLSITIAESSGRERTLSLADGASVPEGLAVGDPVSARVPLQKPFDGKTADRIERPKAKKTPPVSKFRDAQTPKN